MLNEKLDSYYSKKTLLIIACIAAIFGILADISLLYDKNTYYENGILYIKNIGERRIIYGHYVGLISIPIACLGFLPIFNKIKIESNIFKIIFFVIAILTLVCGLSYHTSVLPIWYYLQNINSLSDNYVQSLFFHQNILAVVFVTLFILLNILMIIVFKSNKIRYYFISPLLFYIIISLIYLLHYPITNALMVSGFNISILFFYIYAWKNHTL